MNLTLVGHWREIILVLIRYMLNSIGQSDRKFLLNDFVLRLQIYLTIFFFKELLSRSLQNCLTKRRKYQIKKIKLCNIPKITIPKEKKKECKQITSESHFQRTNQYDTRGETTHGLEHAAVPQ